MSRGIETSLMAQHRIVCVVLGLIPISITVMLVVAVVLNFTDAVLGYQIPLYNLRYVFNRT